MPLPTKHTKGPWRTVRLASQFDKRSEAFGITYGRSGNRLAIVDGEGNASDANAANAQLIKAAPDMLAILKKWATFSVDNDTGDEMSWLEETRAVIAKAKGGDQ